MVSARDVVEQDSGETPSFSAAVLPRVRGVRGVRVAAGVTNTAGDLFDSEGKRVGSQFAPAFIGSNRPPGLEAITYVEGHRPRTASQVSIDEGASKEAGIEIGDTVRLASVERAKRFRVVGVVRLGDASFGGASLAALTLHEAQRITGKEGEFDEIWVAALPGVTEAELRRRISRVVPRGSRSRQPPRTPPGTRAKSATTSASSASPC